MQKTKYKKRIIGIVGLFISIILIIRFSVIVGLLIDFIEKYLSPDNYINPNTIIDIEIIVIFFILLTTTLCVIFFLHTTTSGVIFLLNITRKITLFSNTYFNTDQAKKLFLIDNICSKKQLSLYILSIGMILGFFLHLYLLIIGEPSFEGILEISTSLLYLFSTIILITSIIKINNELFSSRTRRKVIFSIIVLSGILLLIFGEEISWGQRIFGWESSGFFIEHNYQNEINAHNFFNPIFKFIYPIAGMGSFLVLFFIWFFPKRKKTYLFKLFFPHPSLFFLVFIMACSSFSSLGEETFEELFAIFVLLYSFRIFMCLRFPKMDLS